MVYFFKELWFQDKGQSLAYCSSDLIFPYTHKAI